MVHILTGLLVLGFIQSPALAEGKKKPALIKKAPSTQTVEPSTAVQQPSLGAPKDLAPAYTDSEPISNSGDAVPAAKPEFETEEKEGRSSGYGKTRGLLGSIILGPKLTIISFPTPVRFGLEGKSLGYLGFSFDYGIFPTLKLSDVKIGMNQWQIGAKVYPFAGALFLGVGFGKQTFTGSQIQTVQSVSTEIKLVADATVIVPQLGWRWVGDSGFFFGMEFGWQFVLETSSTFSDSTNNAAIKTDATYLSTKAEIEDKANSLLKKGLPQFALLQVGFFF